MSGPPSWKKPRSHLAELSQQMMGEVLACVRSKRFRGAKSEERGFRRFARAKNGARAKIGRRGGGGKRRFPSFPSPSPLF